jgi:hypothetical protein
MPVLGASQNAIPQNTTTATAYTLALADAGCVVRCTNASAVTVTVPTAASVPFPAGTIINIYAAGTAGASIVAASGATVQNNGSALAQYAECSLRYDGANVWVRTG